MSTTAAPAVYLPHFIYRTRDTLRVPVVVISAAVFPVMVFAIFFLPFMDSTPADQQAAIALAGVAQLGLMGVVSTFLFNYGIGIAEERKAEWSNYLRTLPAGPGPFFTARVAVAVIVVLIAVVPLFIVAIAATPVLEPFIAGELGWWRLAALIPAWILAALPFLFGGLLIGYLATPKAAVAITQIAFLPFAAVGGLILPVQAMPGWLNAISEFTPARPGRNAVTALIGEGSVDMLNVVVWLGWLVPLIIAAVWAHRRDEGRRFS